MPKTKEGRRRKSQLDMSTEAGRLMLRDLINFKESGFNPFLPETFDTKKFWESRSEFQEVSFGAFRTQVHRMANIAIAQMPENAKKKEKERINA